MRLKPHSNDNLGLDPYYFRRERARKKIRQYFDDILSTHDLELINNLLINNLLNMTSDEFNRSVEIYQHIMDSLE